MEENISPVMPATRKRPALLTILCVFSFFFSGAMTLFSLGGIIFSNVLTNFVKDSIQGLEDFSSAFFIIIFLVLLILFGLSLWGAILMYGLRKGGFVLYIIPNGLKLVFLIILLLGAFNYYFLIFVMVSIAMIVLYATQIKYMKR
jgi:hypothetical protein